MKAYNVKFIFTLIAFLIAPNVMFSQNRQEWVITKIINTFLQVGVAVPEKLDMKKIAKEYLGKSIHIQNNQLFLPSELKNSNSYADTIFIKSLKQFKTKKDDFFTSSYPGDELNCVSDDVKQNNCFVGESFMRMLESKENYLKFYELKANSPNLYNYKLCIIQPNKRMGLLLENSLLLLIIDKR